MAVQSVEVIKEVEFSSSFAADFHRFVNVHLVAGYAISARPKPGGGGWFVRVLLLAN